MTSAVLAFITFAIEAILILLFVSSVRHRQTMRSVVIGLTLVHESVLIVFPIWYAILTDFRIERDIGIHLGDLVRVMTGEAAFVVLFAAAFSLRMFGQPPRQSADPLDPVNRRFWIMLAIVGLMIAASAFLAPTITYEQALQHAEIQRLDLWDTILGWMRTAVIYPSLIAAAFVLVWPKIQGWVRAAGAAILALTALGGLSQGIRGRLTWVISFGLVAALLRGSKKTAITALLILACVVPFSPFLGGAYRSIFFNDLGNTSHLDALETLVQLITSGQAAKYGDTDVLASMAERAQGPRNSVFLYQLYDLGEGAGMRPIVSAIYVPIPRMFWSSKRPAGSSDSSPYGAAMYVVRSVGYSAPLENMGPMLASAHAYWEGGWLWTLAAGFLTGLFWNWVVTRFYDVEHPLHLVVVLTFTASLFIDGLLTCFNPVYSFIVIFWAQVLPITLLYWALRLWMTAHLRHAERPLPSDAGRAAAVVAR